MRGAPSWRTVSNVNPSLSICMYIYVVSIYVATHGLGRTAGVGGVVGFQGLEGVSLTAMDCPTGVGPFCYGQIARDDGPSPSPSLLVKQPPDSQAGSPCNLSRRQNRFPTRQLQSLLSQPSIPVL